ncbi:tyrosine-type recombinase/integrase [Xanthobacter tagetidis]|uniref:Site-specific integrase n=1 Tax=Xanthobacter tagetidis TaxID=60216 RepID=A0A3L7AE67_9HYPH|nr:site-specific integrase [Xanthobacter tagetidis]MBB6309695.1 integrase [Xanthobacter tagetidis]RLP78264.1 site-specific integrase [Xanthobacter tagetidis]
MANVNLTDTYIRGLSLPAEGRLDINDERAPGLVLRVSSSGTKSWSLRYRDKMSGKVERLTIGRYPAVPLAKAREIALKRIAGIADGDNPRAVQRQEKAAHAAGISFDALAERFLTEYVAVKRPKSLIGYRSALAPARKAWVGKKAREITRDDVLDLSEKRGADAPIAANRMVAVLSKLFNWTLDLRDPPVTTSPVHRIPKPGIEKARTRTLRDDEIPILWAAFDGFMVPEMARIMRVLLLTGQRLSEVVGMERDELLDLGQPESARWHLPGERTKNRRPHIVPLAPSVASIIKAAMVAGGEETSYVFSSRRNPGEKFDRQSFARAMKRLISGLKETDYTRTAVRRLKADPPTPHDLRRTVATQLGALGVRREVIKAVLNHLEGDVTEVYALHDHLAEKRAALDAWAAHVERLTQPTDTTNVVPMRGR